MEIFKQLNNLSLDDNARAVIEGLLDNGYSYGAMSTVHTVKGIKECNLQMEHKFTSMMVIIDCVGGLCAVWRDKKDGGGPQMVANYSRWTVDSIMDFIQNLNKK